MSRTVAVLDARVRAALEGRLPEWIEPRWWDGPESLVALAPAALPAEGLSPPVPTALPWGTIASALPGGRLNESGPVMQLAASPVTSLRRGPGRGFWGRRRKVRRGSKDQDNAVEHLFM